MTLALKAAERSLDELRTLVSAALTKARGNGSYVVELYDDHVIYTTYEGSESGRNFDVPYTIGDDDQVTFGDRSEVKREVSYVAVKRIAPNVVEGLAIPYGIDVDGEQFTAETDLCLEWFGKSGRPLLYDHGLEKPGPSVIGRQIEYEERPDGRWAQGQLNLNHRYRKAVDALIDQGALGFSSGAMQHLVTKRATKLLRWPWVELSLTPVPAHPGAMIHYVKSTAFLEHLEDAETQMSVAAVKAIAAGLDPEAMPDTATLDERAGRVSAAIDELRDHARAAAAMRAKSGRVLSTANRERIRKALEAKPALLEALDDLAALLEETGEEVATKATTPLQRELLAFQAIEARMAGVDLPSVD
jgi:hypothetical protein